MQSRWHYIRYADGSEELYDFQSDPNEWTNLSSQARARCCKAVSCQAFADEGRGCSGSAPKKRPSKPVLHGNRLSTAATTTIQ